MFPLLLCGSHGHSGVEVELTGPLHAPPVPGLTSARRPFFPLALATSHVLMSILNLPPRPPTQLLLAVPLGHPVPKGNLVPGSALFCYLSLSPFSQLPKQKPGSQSGFLPLP